MSAADSGLTNVCSRAGAERQHLRLGRRSRRERKCRCPSLPKGAGRAGRYEADTLDETHVRSGSRSWRGRSERARTCRLDLRSTRARAWISANREQRRGSGRVRRPAGVFERRTRRTRVRSAHLASVTPHAAFSIQETAALSTELRGRAGRVARRISTPGVGRLVGTS